MTERPHPASRSAASSAIRVTTNKYIEISNTLQTDDIIDIVNVMLIKCWHRSCRNAHCRQNLTSSGWFLWDIQRGFGKVREFKPPRGSSRLSCDQVDTQHCFSDQDTIRIQMLKLLNGDQGHLIVRGQNSDKLATSSSPFRVFQIVARPGYWPVPDVNLNLNPYSTLLIRTRLIANYWHLSSGRHFTRTRWGLKQLRPENF